MKKFDKYQFVNFVTKNKLFISIICALIVVACFTTAIVYPLTANNNIVADGTLEIAAIRKGDSGSKVKEIQRKLNEYGFMEFLVAKLWQRLKISKNHVDL